MPLDNYFLKRLVLVPPILKTLVRSYLRNCLHSTTHTPQSLTQTKIDFSLNNKQLTFRELHVSPSSIDNKEHNNRHPNQRHDIPRRDGQTLQKRISKKPQFSINWRNHPLLVLLSKVHHLCQHGFVPINQFLKPANYHIAKNAEISFKNYF